MSKNKKKTEKELLISLNKAAYILNMSDITLQEWLSELKIEIKQDSNNVRCIEYNKDFKKLTNSSQKKEKSQKDIKKYLSDCGAANRDPIQRNIDSNLEKYRSYISLLENHHSRIIKDYDLLNDESPINAALLIFIKIINMCNHFVLAIDEGYNSANILIRTIDEANTLAQYFVILKDDTTCKNDLDRWYKLEKSPSPSECRKKVINGLSKDLPFFKEYLQYLSDEVYQVKSKSVHHSFRDCSELLSLSVENDLIIISGVNYKSVNIFRKSEVVELFESIINNVMQGFIICFKDLLKEQEVNELIRITTQLSFEDAS